ncbi:MAG: reductive dehalogenase domain-containing protein [Anaerolineales bacterium]
MVEAAATAILIGLGGLVLATLAEFAWNSALERERRAAWIALGLGIIGSLPLFGAAWLAPPVVKLVVLGLIGVAGLGAVVLFLMPVGRIPDLPDIPSKRFDERDIVFARSRLVPGSHEYSSYYAMRPENRPIDERFRELPGLLSMEARLANPWAFASAKASFSLTEAMREQVTGSGSTERKALSAPEMTEYVKALACYYGARAVGVVELQSYHVYTHIGRGSGKYGDPIDLPHTYAIAFTVEMSREMMGPAPEAATVMESARQYVEAARIALQLGYFIRHLGFPARAHIDGNYRVIAPLVARDAGLGEIGRMGLLITPELGPRVRLAVVTTDLPLVPDDRLDGRAMIDFCRVCNKCAQNCPSRAIPFDDWKEHDGAYRWRIDADSCFRYWNLIGTDCGRCIDVCPYSHHDSLAHNVVRWGVAHSGGARRAAAWLDDVFYGRRPAKRQAPKWVPPPE